MAFWRSRWRSQAAKIASLDGTTFVLLQHHACICTRAGKVVFEVFQDVVPLPARTFVNRCRQGTTATLHGSQVPSV